MAIIMRLLHPKENNDPAKKHPFYCYKAQLQFVGWLKQHLRRTDFRGQPGPQVEKRRASWQSDKSQPRSRCTAITVRGLSGLETPFQCTLVPIIKLPNFEGKYLSGQPRKCTPPKMPSIIFGLHSLRGDFPPQGKCFQKCPFLWSWGALFSPLLLIYHIFRNRRVWSYHVTKEHNKWFRFVYK